MYTHTQGVFAGNSGGYIAVDKGNFISVETFSSQYLQIAHQTVRGVEAKQDIICATESALPVATIVIVCHLELLAIRK
ncbi:hypothetical protein M5K25_000695 [Dendrobium thyrsiflorum]|uniref:Uncharacterized protein n=1 Tax=Dendrobium thyrsiflorum TaxID=117978 RepID=A0ABD0VWP1_DENTH